MLSRLKKIIISSYSTIDTICMFLISFACLWFNLIAGIICLLISVAVYVYHKSYTEKRLSKRLNDYKAAIINDRDDMMQAFASGAPLLVCTVDRAKNLLWYNDKFETALVKTNEWEQIKDNDEMKLVLGSDGARAEIRTVDRVYNVNSVFLTDNGERMLFFRNDTARDNINTRYKEEKLCMAIVEVDNYDDILLQTTVENKSIIAAEIDSKIYEWANSLGAAICKADASRYDVFFVRKELDKLMAGDNCFAILNDMHSIKTETDYPVSLSIGIGYGEAELSDLQDSALEAIELAQGRGGDQAVVRQRGGETQFFGGVLPAVEMRSKARVGVMAHSLQNLISDADKVLILGHTRPDMDSFGSAIGVYAFAHNIGREAHIILEESNEAIDLVYNEAKGLDYSFISHNKAMELLTRKTLLVMVDHHRAANSEFPELVEKANNIAIIDHHRMAADAVMDARFSYIAAYTSSASELIVEVLELSGNRGEISRYEANALLSGIALDTKNFSENTGARTFEAAGWLRKNGADMAVVKNYFRVDLDFYQKKVNAIANAQFIDDGIVVAYTKDSDPAMNVIVSQAADELLKMKGVECVVVAGKGPKQTMVSARSESGKFNVQTLMEKLGGGGHQNSAAVQLNVGPEEAISAVVQAMRLENMIK